MSDRSLTPASVAAARVAGLGYLCIVFFGFYASMFVAGRVVVWDDAAATARNLLTQEFLFRSGIVAELVMCAGVVLSGACLYLALRHVNNGLATVAASFRLAEGAIVAIVVLMKFAALDVLTGGDPFAAFNAAQLESFALLFLHLHGLSIYIVVLLMGLGCAIFCYLLFASRSIPRFLSAWGMLTYTQMVVGAVFVILFPQYWQWVQISFAPGALFELTLGLWLLIAGLKPSTAAKGGRS